MDRDDSKPVDGEPLARRAAPERFGKYRNLRRIGQGGMADVFLAGWRGPGGFDKLVVVKRLRDEVATDAAFREMFLDEARLAARLNHPNVVQTYEVFEDEGAHFITMEYLEGQPLSRLLREATRLGVALEVPMCARIVSDMLCGLHYAHEARDYDGAPLQIVHRDVSPQNIFVTYDGQVKVVDFGIAKAELSSTQTQVGFFKGKAAYMAPEQLEGAVAIDRRVDVFTTGIILWELLTGRKLMAAESTAKTLVRLLKDPIPRVSDVVPDIDPELDLIVARALERDRTARYQTAGEMRNALEQYLANNHYSVRSEEIGTIVADVFRDVRAELRREVSEQMARVSQFPRSGQYPRSGHISVDNMAATSTGSQALNQPASMSGISVSRTASSVYTAQPLGTGLIPAPDQPTGLRMQSIVVGALVAVSVAVVFAMVERTRGVPPMQPPPPAPAALAPVATHSSPPPQVDPMPPDPPRLEPSSLAAPPTPAPRAVQAPSGGRARPQWSEARQGAAGQRASAPTSGAANATQPTNAVPAVAAEPPAPRAALPVPASAPQPSSPSPPAAATQEGRKFRTSL